jgi:hypothetical protein
MTPEDRLRDLLREEATTIVPAGDGLARIQDRLARRRRLRMFVVPGAALATAGAATAFFLLGGGTGPTTLTQVPGGTGTPQPTPTCRKIADYPCASDSTPPGPASTQYDGPAVWPFTTAAEAEAWRSTAPWATDKKQVAGRFATGLLGLKGVTTGTVCESCDLVELRLGGALVGTATLVRYDVGGTRVYTVVAVDGGDLKVTRPTAGAAVTSPTSVSGRITGVDENVSLSLVTQAGKKLATAGAPAGSAVPWQASLSWSDTSWSHGAIVGKTFSLKDGALTRLVVVPVTRATGASAGPSFVGLQGGHVTLFDAADGSQTKQLTFPPAGRTDTGAAWAAGTMLWVRSQQTGCNDELNRLDNGTPSTVVKAGTAHLGTPQLSPAAGWLAWVQTPCSGGSASIVVSGGGAPDRVLAVPSGTTAAVLDIRDDGVMLVHTNDAAASGPGTIGIVAAGVDTLDTMTPLTPTGSCYLAGGAAFDGTDPAAFETCGSGSRLARFTDQGARTSTGPAVAGMAAPRSTTAHTGDVLVWLADGSVARYRDGHLTSLLAAGVQAPDW